MEGLICFQREAMPATWPEALRAAKTDETVRLEPSSPPSTASECLKFSHFLFNE